jgi:hypothetical protein
MWFLAARCERGAHVVSEIDAADSTSTGPSARPSGASKAPTDPTGPLRCGGGATRPVTAPGWRARYVRRVAATELAILVAALVVAVRCGLGNSSEDHGLATVVASGTALCFAAALLAAGGWEAGSLGQGSLEFRRLFRSAGVTVVLVGLVGLGLHPAAARPYVFGFVSAWTAAVIALARHAHRTALRRRRDADRIEGVPVVGDLDGGPTEVSGGRDQVVAVASNNGRSPRRLHEMAWDMDGCGVELVVGVQRAAAARRAGGRPPAATAHRAEAHRWLQDRAGRGRQGRRGAAAGHPRPPAAGHLRGRPDGRWAGVLPLGPGRAGRPHLLDTQVPLDGGRRRAAAPGAGPARRRALRARGRPSGHPGRETTAQVLPGRVAATGQRPAGQHVPGGAPPPGAPAGDPARERARLAGRVNPGITGLGPLGGRGDLSWEESARLDLRYVENWSLSLDLLSLEQTMRTVMSGDRVH